MSKVPEYPKPKQNNTTAIICTKDGKPLTPEDQKAVEEYMAFRAARYKNSRL